MSIQRIMILWSIWTFCFFLSGKSQHSLVSKGVLASIIYTTPSTGSCSMLPVSVTYEVSVHQLSALIEKKIYLFVTHPSLLWS